MAEFTHGKYILTHLKENIVVPKWGGNLDPKTTTRVFYLDSKVIEGANYVEVVWFLPTDKKDNASPDPHTAPKAAQPQAVEMARAPGTR